MEKNKCCLNCDADISSGRWDKKYCNAKCKANYHNKQQRDKEQSVREITGIIRNNWKILKMLNPSGHTTIRKSYLIEHGYNFNYFTNIYKTSKGKVYYFCFDMGFSEVEKGEVDKVNIVIWQSYMKTYNLPVGKVRK
jgi:hypothetical protein